MMKKTKRAMGLALSVVLAVGMFSGCGDKNSAATGSSGASKEISVVSREDGSGTRGAFVELTGVQEKDADGNKIDNTTDEAVVVNSTEIVITTVKGDENSIGYISLGSMSDDVKGIKVDGVEATAENINNGSYTLARPFNVVTKDGLNDAAKDFLDFIMSAEGQEVIAANGYIEVENTGEFMSNGATGKIVVAGSSSVTPVMEKLKEAYIKVNTEVEIEIQESDSTTGVNSVTEGICDIGMASRELSEEEAANGLNATAIAMDGIVVIVNPANEVEELSKDQIKDVFCGTITDWSELQ